ncbi:GTP-binding protein REM 2 [Lepisosteus oculatus]
MTLSSAPPHRRGSTPLPIKHQLRREEAVSEDGDWASGLAGPSPPPIGFSPASEEAGGGDKEARERGCPPDRDEDGPVRIALLGQNGVGKSSLASALSGINDRTASVDSDNVVEDGYVRTVIVDEEEVTVIVYDNWKQDLSLLNCEVCLLVFSVTDRRSFHRAAQLRLQLRESHPQTPIILVGNKTDLVRSREVSAEEAHSSALLFECQYYEISASLDHCTSELLEGAVRCARGWSTWQPGSGVGGVFGLVRRESLTSRAKRFLSSLVPRYPSSAGRFFRQKSRSCHDLSSL